MIQDLQRLYRRIMTLIGRARTRIVDDSGTVQVMQVVLDTQEIHDMLMRVAEYGFASSPPEGTDAVILFIGGLRERGVVIATNHQTYRMKGLKPGETALYDNLGQSVYLTQGGIVINGAGLPVTVTNTPQVQLDTPLVKTTKDLHVGGNIVAEGDITDNNATTPKTMAGMRLIHNEHTHPENNVSGGSTNPPNQLM